MFADLNQTEWPSDLVLGVNISTLVNQQFEDDHRIEASGEMERGAAKLDSTQE